MKAVARSWICCLVVSACSTDPTEPEVHLRDVKASRDVTTAATWNLIQLGFDPNYVMTVPEEINNRYQMIGSSIDAAGRSHQFTQRLGGARQYLNADFVARALNDLGIVAGSYRGVPAYWDADQHVTLIPGVTSGSAVDISETGWIVGAGTLTDGRNRNFLWRPGWAQARVLGERFPASFDTRVVSVNNLGQSTGQIETHVGVWDAKGDFNRIQLPDSVYNFSAQAAEISDAGQVVGHLAVKDALWGGLIAGFLWTKGRPLTVMMAPTRHGRVQLYATDIDRQGRVYGNLRSDAINEPIVLIAGVINGLPFVQYDTRVIDVNDCGVGVGFGMLFGGPPGVQHLWLTEC